LRLFSLNHIDFILVETNGSELEVVRGMEAILPITRRLGVRGHVRRDGVPINAAIADYLTGKGFRTSITTEGIVLAEQWPRACSLPIHRRRRRAGVPRHEDQSVLLNLLILGGAACAPTTLTTHVQPPPDISLPVKKRPEPHFFYKSAEYSHAIDYYERRYF